jgi:hypothetical protein
MKSGGWTFLAVPKRTQLAVSTYLPTFSERTMGFVVQNPQFLIWTPTDSERLSQNDTKIWALLSDTIPGTDCEMNRMVGLVSNQSSFVNRFTSSLAFSGNNLPLVS